MAREVSQSATSGGFEHILVVGCGHMGGALVSRWGAESVVGGADAGTRLPNLFSIIDRSPNAPLGTGSLLPPRFQAYASLEDFTQSRSPMADALLLAVRPQQVLAALSSIVASEQALLSPNATIMSLAAGLPLARLRASLTDLGSPLGLPLGLPTVASPLFRVMPSIPVAIGEGILLISSDGEEKTDDDDDDDDDSDSDAFALVRELFAPMGRSVFCSDELLDKGTGLWGSAPGYLFQMIEAFAESARALGYEAEQARILAFQTFKGVGIFAEKQHTENNLSPEQLVASIALAGGTTEAGLRVLRDKETGLVPLMLKAGELAYQRAQSMAQEMQTEMQTEAGAKTEK